MDSAASQDDFIIRPATAADIKWLVRHRCEMFKDIGWLQAAAYEPLAEAAARYFATALPAGEYLAFLAAPADDPANIVAGGGMQLRYNLPSLTDEGLMRKPGPQGIVVNVYTEHAWRGHGLATRVMQALIAWCRANGVTSLVLHASAMGRPIYEKLGFVQSNEMVFPSRLLRPESE